MAAILVNLVQLCGKTVNFQRHNWCLQPDLKERKSCTYMQLYVALHLLATSLSILRGSIQDCPYRKRHTMCVLTQMQFCMPPWKEKYLLKNSTCCNSVGSKFLHLILVNSSQVLALLLKQHSPLLVIGSGCCFDSRDALKIHFLRLPGGPQ